ncbi:MAG: DUF763 domain-containing protein [Archaeoglobus sp.]|uniref:DUF763 domain-containing protein n=1 Tax=Archaeoglobus sp. TaxID=1872626 RepID=UPI001D63FE86|nr:DUF763 domain-containing protein [Archaeoglobus sp.]MBO8180545.1 DUF763 domain-containing protein [Archaeoglobus sp.]
MKEIYLPLHHGKAPYWLLNRMKKLAKPIVKLIVMEYGEREFLERLSNPIFFQSLSNVLGFDWNSSGVTTVLTGVLKAALNNEEFDIRVAGGKGKNALKTPEEIMKLSEEIGANGERLVEFSRLAAKADNAALIDGYSLYHHAVIFTPKHFTVIQQGMSETERLARRYHWNVYSNIPELENVHDGIITEKREKEVVNMLSELSRDTKRLCVDIVRDGSFRKDYEKLVSVLRWRKGLRVPRKIDWKVVEMAYNLQPERFEDILLIRGFGKETVRALALVAEIVYNTEYDKTDPAKYCFAVGGKDGVPFPVRMDIYDEIIEFMRETVKQAEIGDFEKKKILERLSRTWM